VIAARSKIAFLFFIAPTTPETLVEIVGNLFALALDNQQVVHSTSN
jgi:hypothetical protein